MTTYKEIPSKLKNHEEFQGNSITAKYNNNDYEVYSYNTLLYSTKNDYFNNRYYSVTTSKIQNILIEVYELNNNIKKRG